MRSIEKNSNKITILTVSGTLVINNDLFDDTLGEKLC